jgi:hypothetical protein
LAAWLKMLSAALSLVAGGVLASTMSFPRVAAAAPDICCRRAIDCEKAARRAFRYAASNSGPCDRGYMAI